MVNFLKSTCGNNPIITFVNWFDKVMTYHDMSLNITMLKDVEPVCTEKCHLPIHCLYKWYQILERVLVIFGDLT